MRLINFKTKPLFREEGKEPKKNRNKTQESRERTETKIEIYNTE